MALPAWKVNLLERKKKLEEEEKLKKVQQEEKKLASLPAWKRAIIMREKVGGASPSSTNFSSDPATRGADSIIGTSPQKWKEAVERVKGPDSPILKRAPPTSVQKAPALMTSSGIATTTTSSQRPAAQRNVLNRWAGGAGVQTTNGKSTTTKSTGGKLTANKRRESSTSSPVVRRSATFTASSSENCNSPSSRRLPSNTGSNSPVARTVTSKWPAATTNSISTSGSTPSVKSTAATAQQSTKASSTSATDEDDPSLAHLPPWKRAIILKKRRAQQSPEGQSKPVGQDETDCGPVPDKNTTKDKESESRSRSATNEARSRSASNEARSRSASNEARSRSASNEARSKSGREEASPKPERQEAAAIVIKQPVPEVVNRPTVDNVPEQRLVQQEGKTLHPPVYKEVDQWANVSEEDDKFKNLPLWKQALIKRRRADIALRSGQQVSVSPTLPADNKKKTSSQESPNKSANKKNNSAATGRNVSDGKSTKKTASNLKSTKKQTSSTSKTTGSTGRKATSGPSSRKATEPTQANTKTTASAYKPARKAPSAPPTTEKSEPFISYHFSKHHSFDTGGSSSDCTDSDLEDAVVTNLDGDSDESDSGIVLRKYTSSSSNINKNNEAKRSSSSILVVPGKKEKKKMRRVSWSDSLLTSEHIYPKYDYSDYDELEEEPGDNHRPEKKSEFSHRLHPSLLPPSDGDPYAAGFSPPGYLQGNSLSSFVPSSLSPPALEDSYSSEFKFQQEDTSKRDSSTSTSGPVDYSEYYSDQSSNTAALLW